MEKSYKEYLHHITTFIFDVDGVFTDGTITIDANGEMLRTMHTKDGFALKTALLQGYNVCIISGGTNKAVKSRFAALGVTHIYLGAHYKTDPFDAYITEKGIDPKNILFMGDDMPDIPLLQRVGLPTCPQDAVSEVKAVSDYISNKNGGKGCVRDVIEQVLKVQGKWATEFDAKYD